MCAGHACCLTALPGMRFKSLVPVLRLSSAEFESSRLRDDRPPELSGPRNSNRPPTRSGSSPGDRGRGPGGRECIRNPGRRRLAVARHDWRQGLGRSGPNASSPWWCPMTTAPMMLTGREWIPRPATGSCQFEHIPAAPLRVGPSDPSVPGIMSVVLFELHRSFVLFRNRAREFRRAPSQVMSRFGSAKRNGGS